MHALDRAELPVDTRSMTTADVDEARVTISTYFYSTFLDVLGPAADLSARFDLVTSGPVTIGDLCFGVDVGMRFGELGAYHVDLPLTGELWWRQGRRVCGRRRAFPRVPRLPGGQRTERGGSAAAPRSGSSTYPLASSLPEQPIALPADATASAPHHLDPAPWPADQIHPKSPTRFPEDPEIR